MYGEDGTGVYDFTFFLETVKRMSLFTYYFFGTKKKTNDKKNSSMLPTAFSWGKNEKMVWVLELHVFQNDYHHIVLNITV